MYYMHTHKNIIYKKANECEIAETSLTHYEIIETFKNIIN